MGKHFLQLLEALSTMGGSRCDSLCGPAADEGAVEAGGETVRRFLGSTQMKPSLSSISISASVFSPSILARWSGACFAELTPSSKMVGLVASLFFFVIARFSFAFHLIARYTEHVCEVTCDMGSE